MVGRVGFGLVGFDSDWVVLLDLDWVGRLWTIVLADWLAWLVGRLLAGFNAGYSLLVAGGCTVVLIVWPCRRAAPTYSPGQ
jgi:hypothetical protein